MKLNTVKLGILALGIFAFSLNMNAQDEQDEFEAKQEKNYKKHDLDGDGSVTLEEFKNKPRKREIPADRLEKSFNNMDKDSDGILSLEEFTEAARKRAAKKAAKDE